MIGEKKSEIVEQSDRPLRQDQTLAFRLGVLQLEIDYMLPPSGWEGGHRDLLEMPILDLPGRIIGNHRLVMQSSPLKQALGQYNGNWIFALVAAGQSSH